MTKPTVPVPPLNMLQENSLGPDPVEIMHVRKIIFSYIAHTHIIVNNKYL